MLGLHCTWAFSICSEQGLSRCDARASHWGGFSSCGAQAVGSMGFSSCGPWAYYSMACGIFLDQELNLCPLHWQIHSQPLDHQRSPIVFFFFFFNSNNFLPILVKVKSLSRVQLCDPMDCRLQGSSIHGILQARVLEWVAVSFSTCPY